MKKIKYTLYTVLIILMIGYSCKPEKVDYKDDFETIIIDGCEYMYNYYFGYKSLVHKGNCTSEVHKCICD